MLRSCVGATNRVHDPVAAREQVPAVLAGELGDLRNRRPGIVPTGDHPLELADVAVARRGVDEPAAALRVTLRQRIAFVTGAAARREQQGGEDEEGGAARRSGPLPILNRATESP
jgi:hypothetical protein